MDIILNGKIVDIPNGTFAGELIKSKNLNAERIIIQVNDDIIKKQQFNTFLLHENSRVEILSIVGGGWYGRSINNWKWNL